MLGGAPSFLFPTHYEGFVPEIATRILPPLLVCQLIYVCNNDIGNLPGSAKESTFVFHPCTEWKCLQSSQCLRSWLKNKTPVSHRNPEHVITANSCFMLLLTPPNEFPSAPLSNGTEIKLHWKTHLFMNVSLATGVRFQIWIWCRTLKCNFSVLVIHVSEIRRQMFKTIHVDGNGTLCFLW